MLLLLVLGLQPALRGTAPPTSIRVATYNVENYLVADRRVDGRWRPEYPKPEAEKAALREILLRIRPDILAIQEMGSRPFLEELQRDLRALGLDYPVAKLLEGPDPVRHLAVLSRIPVVAVGDHPTPDFPYLGERFPVKRGLQHLIFETSGIRWSLFNVHLKSRWTEHPEDPQASTRRTAEAQAIRDLIRQIQPPGEPDSRYLVVGDFNDLIDSPTLRRFLQVSETTLTRAVPALDSRGESWTYHFARRQVYERVDFMLASPAMEPLIRGGAAVIVDLLPESRQASDHRMIYLDLDFPRAVATR